MMGTMKLKLAIAGSNVVIAGLALQVATFILFLVVAANFHIKMLRFEDNSAPNIHSQTGSLSTSTSKMPLNPIVTPPNPTEQTFNPNGARWKMVMRDLYILSVLILVRCVFRVVEYAMGNGGFLNAHEAFLYVFDACLMVAVLIFMAVARPARWLPKKNLEIQSQGMEME